MQNGFISIADLLPLGSGLETESQFEGRKSRLEDGVEDASRAHRRVGRRRGSHAKRVGGYRQEGTDAEAEAEAEATLEEKNGKKRA